MSILTSIGQGDRYFDELYKKYDLNPKKVAWNKDGSMDYDGDVSFYKKDITKIPFKFNKVKGCFDCSDCDQLPSLEGCPKEVRYFICSFCHKLMSLEGCPKNVEKDFVCYGCGREFTEEEVKKYCNVKGLIYV